MVGRNAQRTGKSTNSDLSVRKGMSKRRSTLLHDRREMRVARFQRLKFESHHRAIQHCLEGIEGALPLQEDAAHLLNTMVVDLFERIVLNTKASCLAHDRELFGVRDLREGIQATLGEGELTQTVLDFANVEHKRHLEHPNPRKRREGH